MGCFVTVLFSVILFLAIVIALASPLPIHKTKPTGYYESQPPFYFMPMGAPVFKFWHPHGYFNLCPFVRPLPLDPVWNQGCRPLPSAQPSLAPQIPQSMQPSTQNESKTPVPPPSPLPYEFESDDEEEEEDLQDDDQYDHENENEDYYYEKYSK